MFGKSVHHVFFKTFLRQTCITRVQGNYMDKFKNRTSSVRDTLNKLSSFDSI